ncbi:MAG: response regulator transcription factor [Chloroflexi bacterium]|nr:response regulator transcription factor [Chloroflexota bacterium]
MKGKILLVDDEEAIRYSLGEILKLEGYDVTPAESGEAALNVLTKHAFDLILLDLKMPGIGGLEVMRAASKSAPDTRIILLTAHGSMESAVEALRHGAHDYILKPATSRTILSSVEKALALRAEQQRKRLLLEQLDASLQRLKDAEGMDGQVVVEQQTIPLDDGVVLDISRREIWQGNLKVNLTPTEGKLMKILLENRGRVLSHRELVFLVQGYEATDWEAPEVLRPLISRLRRKLSTFPAGERWIVNVRGTGYLFDLGQAAAGGEEAPKAGA